MISFDESYMTAAFTKSAMVPGTSRVERFAAKSPRTQVRKTGLPRSCVVVTRKWNDATTYEVFVKGSGALLGTVQTHKGPKAKAYSFQLARDGQSQSGFATQRAAVKRMLECV